MNLSFWMGKRVFLTGHTGFKGSWLSRILVSSGAKVTGYSLEPVTTPSLFSLSCLEKDMHSVNGDIRDKAALEKAFQEANPEIVLHLAAQPLVLESYRDPVGTYETNVMGTVNILECVRKSQQVCSVLNVTTDKVYENREWPWGYRETDPLDGYDPYSNSKSCSELVTHSYKNSFFKESACAISTARAGNVIGGGDFADNRIVPDCVRAAGAGEPIIVRNPYSVRPYQHVLEPLFAYLMIAARQVSDSNCAGYYNIGPDESDCVSTKELVESFCRAWGENLSWENHSTGGPHEAGLLKLDCALIKAVFGWKPAWNIDTAVARTVDWSRTYLSGGDVHRIMDEQIAEYRSVFTCLNP